MAGRSKDIASSYHAVAVTPNDSTVIPTTRGLYIGVSGNVTARMAQTEVDCTFANVPVGVFPIQVDRVYSTGTTATSIVALY